MLAKFIKRENRNSDGARMTLKNEQERVTLCCAFVIKVGNKHFAVRTEEPRLGTERRLAASATKVRILCLVQLSVYRNLFAS